jgi:hypothetical protein
MLVPFLPLSAFIDDLLQDSLEWYSLAQPQPKWIPPSFGLLHAQSLLRDRKNILFQPQSCDILILKEKS